jgi:hypothetical protein
MRHAYEETMSTWVDPHRPFRPKGETSAKGEFLTHSPGELPFRWAMKPTPYAHNPRVEPYGKKVKSALYRVIDEYTLFYLKWIEPAPKGILARGGARHWQAMSQTAGYAAWAGYAFESICLKHARELESALGIENLVTAVGSWRFLPSGRTPHRMGAQIDLLFERRDGVINLCEMKFSTEPFVVTKAYARELRDKIALFEAQTKTKKRVILTLVAPLGLKRNAWSEGLIEQVVDESALLR